MALPASGAISLNQVNVELGSAGTTSINMNQSTVRTLFGVASGAIAMSNGYGKANQFAFSITTAQTNANLRTLAVNAGWDQSIKVVATINSGVVMTSNTVGTPGLTINGAWPSGIELINNGTIAGRGGNGGGGGIGGSGPSHLSNNPLPGSGGTAGGLALTISVAASIRNNGTIAGGGGGGGGGGGYGTNDGTEKDAFYSRYGGGGGGGGRSSNTNSSGGAGGAGPTSAGVAGSAGTFAGAGAGGRGGVGPSNQLGGTGGSWGAGGGGGAKWSDGAPGGGGGGAGPATSGQGNVTWLATGTRLGPLG